MVWRVKYSLWNRFGEVPMIDGWLPKIGHLSWKVEMSSELEILIM